MTKKDEVEAEIKEAAVQAEADIEQAIVRLQAMADERRKDPVKDAQYETLRDLLVKFLSKNGPVYYLDTYGNKRYAFAVVPEPLIVDPDKLVALVAAGELEPEVLESVTYRKVNNEAFKKACATGKITMEQLLKVAHKEKGTGHVRFANPEDE